VTLALIWVVLSRARVPPALQNGGGRIHGDLFQAPPEAALPLRLGTIVAAWEMPGLRSRDEKEVTNQPEWRGPTCVPVGRKET
jgi:hypothetical protein